MDDVGHIPKPLYGYLAAVAIAGPVVAAVVAALSGVGLTSADLPRAAMLVTLAALAERYPIHLSHKTAINTATAAYLAMIVIFPAGATGLLALTAIVAGQLLRRSDPVEGAFNTGQGTLYVVAGAVTYGLISDISAVRQLWGEPIVPVILASAAMHLVNSLLVSGAAALQMRLSPLKIWLGNIAFDDLASHVSLTALGFVGALLVRDYPLALPVLGLPAILIQRSLDQTIKLRADTHGALAALVSVVELRDPYTAGHSKRVASTARALALRLGLTAEEADVVESAGHVHDIGKIAIDPEIVAKPGRLTDAEWTQMRLHPVHSAHVISNFNAYIACHGMVRHHHESWDGNGYPDGLVADSIPLGARILAVADTYDALTSDRPYRRGMADEQAITILTQGAGTQWDPRVVTEMLEYLAERSPGESSASIAEQTTTLPAPA